MYRLSVTTMTVETSVPSMQLLSHMIVKIMAMTVEVIFMYGCAGSSLVRFVAS